MRNVTFKRLIDNVSKGSYTDFDLLLAPVSITAPEVKTQYVDIAGRNGALDLTEALGVVNYSDRKIKLEFTAKDGFSTIYNKYSDIVNFLHGRRVIFTLPQDTDFYYVGRCEVGSFDRAKRTGQIEIDVEAEPYKYKQNVTTVTEAIGQLPYTVILDNLSMRTIPRITTTDNVKFEYGSATYNWEAGEHINTSIVLDEGENTFTFIDSSSGTVTFEYQEGKL